MFIFQKKRIEEFFGIATNATRRACIRENALETFKRKRTARRDEENPYSRPGYDRITAAIDTVQDILRDQGREGIPLHLYKLYQPTDSRGPVGGRGGEL